MTEHHRHGTGKQQPQRGGGTSEPRATRVAILHFAGPPTIGGVEATMAAHALVMNRRGVSVRIIAGSAGAIHPDVATMTMPELGSRGEIVETVNRELARGEISQRYHTLVAQIVDWLREALAGVDVAIVHNVLTLHKNLAFTAALEHLHHEGNGPRILAWCHDFAWLDPLYQNDLHDGEPWNLLRRPWPGVHYVVVSHDRRSMLAELLGVPLDDIVVATPGVDLESFLKLEPDTVALVRALDLLAAEPLLLLPARITRRKNIELAVAIVGAMRNAGARPKLLVTGPPGPHNPTNALYLAHLQQLRAESGADDGVVFLYETFVDEHGAPRPVSDAMLADLYRLADGLLFPSKYEGFGIPIIEAGLAGVPIFCSDIAPFRETAGPAAHYFGLDAPPAQIARHVLDTLAADHRAAFRGRVRRIYTWEAIYTQIIEPLIHH